MKIEIKYGSASKNCKNHGVVRVVGNSWRLCDNRTPKTNYGTAGGKFKDVTCKRCRKRMKRMAQNGTEFILFTSEEKIDVVDVE